MKPTGREIVSYDNGRWRVSQPFLYVVETYDPMDLSDVERAVLKRHTVGHVEIDGENEYLVHSEITITIAHRVHRTAPRTNEDTTVVAECEGASSSYIASVNGDLETRWETDVVEIEAGRYPGIADNCEESEQRS